MPQRVNSKVLMELSKDLFEVFCKLLNSFRRKKSTFGSNLDIFLARKQSFGPNFKPDIAVLQIQSIADIQASVRSLFVCIVGQPENNRRSCWSVSPWEKMASGVSRKISAASARAHTRRHKNNTSNSLPSGMLKTALAVLFIGFLAWAYQAVQPPPPKICGSTHGPPITAPRIKLRDGRHLAYHEHGVPKDAANYKIIFVHGFDSCRHDAVVAKTLSPNVAEEMGVYIVSFDRPGYGESDPDPKRTVKSLALDIEELADQLGLGSKVYVIGFSMGGQVIWSCLKYIPHRLAGAVLIAPVVNYWWAGLPANLTSEAYYQQKPQDQWALRVSHYIPWLTYWWNIQRWFPASSVIAQSSDVLSRQDKELMPKILDRKSYMAQVRQQGEYETVHQDMNIGFGTWEFSPLDLENPFQTNEGSVHLWQGDEDLLVPVTLQRYIAKNLSWIHYHELPGAGHMFPLADGMGDTIIKSLGIGK